MLDQPLRFIHAANLLLEHPLEGTGRLSEDAQKTAEQATRIAFDRIISACVEREVDFLLLTGNTFEESQQSLQAEIALLDGFRRLAEHEVLVFVAPGAADPPQAWQAIADLPDNVALCSPTSIDSITVKRDDAVVARITPVDTSPSRAFRDFVERRAGTAGHHAKRGRVVPSDERDEVFRIGLIEAAGPAQPHPDDAADADRNVTADVAPEDLNAAGCDYLAIVGPSRRHTLTLTGGIAHCPGRPQGVHCGHTGPQGCTLVEVDADKTVGCTFLPLAPVRWESFRLALSPAAGRDDVAAQMANSLGSCRPEFGEQLWLVSWHVENAVESPQWFEAGEGQQRLIEAIRQNATFAEPLQVEHRFQTHWGSRDQPAQQLAEGERQLAAYFELLIADHDLPRAVLDRCLEDAGLSQSMLTDRVGSIFANLDHDRVIAQARRLGMRMFASTPEQGCST